MYSEYNNNNNTGKFKMTYFNENDYLVFQIDLNNLKKYRKKYPFLKDRR